MRNARLMQLVLSSLLLTGAGACRLRTTAPPLGDKALAPAFALESTAGRLDSQATLASGPLVLVFYRGHWWLICRRQLGQLQELLPQIKSRGATLWAISVDKLADSQALAQKLKLTYPLAVDPELRALHQFGVQMDGELIAVPATYVLRAGDGQVVYRHIGETLFDRPAASAILTALDQARP